MKIETVKYVSVGEVLTEELFELFNESDLPWTFGDCELSLILPASLLGWIIQQVECDEIDESPCLPVASVLEGLAKDNVLIAL
jgi:hypothetical protein